jgi:hypothetical protein
MPPGSETTSSTIFPKSGPFTIETIDFPEQQLPFQILNYLSYLQNPRFHRAVEYIRLSRVPLELHDRA